jgi:hypothetical protein
MLPVPLASQYRRGAQCAFTDNGIELGASLNGGLEGNL